jgi:hypothetical protein
MSLFRYIKAMLIFARFQPWVNQPEWKAEDAKALERFLVTPTGHKLKAKLLNLVLRQQASAINNTKDLEFNAGVAVGQRALVAGIESMADQTQFTEQGETDDADHAAN